MKMLECIINLYYGKRDIWLGNFNVICGFTIVLGILLLEENKRYTIYKLIRSIFFSLQLLIWEK